MCISLKETWKLKDWKEEEFMHFAKNLRKTMKYFLFSSTVDKWQFAFYFSFNIIKHVELEVLLNVSHVLSKVDSCSNKVFEF